MVSLFRSPRFAAAALSAAMMASTIGSAAAAGIQKSSVNAISILGILARSRSRAENSASINQISVGPLTSQSANVAPSAASTNVQTVVGTSSNNVIVNQNQ